MKIKNTLALAALSLLACACTKDIKNDIDDLKKPVPTGAILLSETATVATDGTFPVLFRVNPSDYTPAKEDVALLFSDATSFDLNNPVPDGKCSIVSLEAYVVDGVPDGAAPGAWKAVFKAESASSFDGIVNMRLGITYTRADNEGKASIFADHTLSISKYASPSASTITATQPVTQTALSITDGEWLTAYSTLSAVTAADGGPAYDLSLIDYVNVTMTGAMADCIEPVVDPGNWLKIGFRPVPDKFATLSANKEYVSAIAEAEIMDKLMRTYTQKIRVRFYPNKVIIPAPAELTFPQSALDDELADIELDYAEALGKIGLNALFIQHGLNKNAVSFVSRQEPEPADGAETYVSPVVDPTIINDPTTAKVSFIVNKSPNIAPGSYYGVIRVKVLGDDGAIVDAEIWQEVKFTE